MNASDEPPSPRRARAYAPAWLALLAGFAMSAVAAAWFWEEAGRMDQLRFQTTVTNLIEQLDTRTARYAEELKRFADFLATQPEVSENTWEECISRPAPPGNLPAFLELAYVTQPSMPTRAEVESLLKSNVSPSGKALLPKRGPQSLSLTRHWRNACTVTPQETETWLHHPQITARWWATLDGRLIASPRRLVPGLNGQPLAAVSLLAPIFADDFLELSERHSSVEIWRLRAQRFKAHVVGTIRWQPIRDAVFATGAGQVEFEAFADATNAAEMTAENWMGVGGPAESQVLKPGFQPRLKHIQPWPFYRARWQLAFYSTNLFDRQSTRGRAWVALGGGMSLTVLMAGLLAVQVRARRNQETIASQLRLALAELGAARKERERLSHDLHDGAIQSLYAMQLSMSRAAEQAEAAQPILGRRLSDIRRNLTAVIVELRGFILQHEAEPGPTGDLVSVLTAIVERLRGSTDTTLCAQLSTEASSRLASEQAVHLANLAREALSNALRHAEASRVTITLRDEGAAVALEIQDDGCGFDRESPRHKSLGLASMTSRAREAGGELRIESQPGKGTRVAVLVPVPSIKT
ncbi:MAG: sensor histidine kinase [Verrucomicrobia bacterium]|nr:sensor histidine kinase [Verrucomicrobiota bacterium]